MQVSAASTKSAERSALLFFIQSALRGFFTIETRWGATVCPQPAFSRALAGNGDDDVCTNGKIHTKGLVLCGDGRYNNFACAVGLWGHGRLGDRRSLRNEHLSASDGFAESVAYAKPVAVPESIADPKPITFAEFVKLRVASDDYIRTAARRRRWQSLRKFSHTLDVYSRFSRL